MALEGMDVELANTQAGQLQTQVIDQIQQAIQSVSHVIAQIAHNWTGPDAQQFHNDWMSHLLPQMNNVSHTLATFHTTFVQNINEQVGASGGSNGGGGIHSPGAIPFPGGLTPQVEPIHQNNTWIIDEQRMSPDLPDVSVNWSGDTDLG